MLVSNLNLPCLIEGNVSNKKEVVEKWMGKLGLSSWSQVAYMGKYHSSQNSMVLLLSLDDASFTQNCVCDIWWLPAASLSVFLLSVVSAIAVDRPRRRLPA